MKNAKNSFSTCFFSSSLFHFSAVGKQFFFFGAIIYRQYICAILLNSNGHLFVKKKKHLLNWSIIQHLISVLCSGTCFRALILVLVLIFWSHSNGSKYSHTIAILKIELNFKFIENCLFWLWFKYCALCCASVRFSANLCAIQLPIM